MIVNSLYSINFTNQKNINWIQNFKPENEIIFNGNPINIFNDQILISTKIIFLYLILMEKNCGI